MEKLRVLGVAGAASIILDFVINIAASRVSNESNQFILEVMAIMICFLTIYLVAINFIKRNRRNSWIEYRDALQYRALIAAVSPQKAMTPAEVAIRHHLPKLTHCWLLVTSQAKDNFDMIEEKYRMKPEDGERYPGDDGHEIIFERETLINPDDIQEVFNIVKKNL